MATYSTDLTTLTTAESGTWTEFTVYSSAGTPAADGENYIQGTDCRSQTTGKAVGLTISIVFDNGTNVTFATNEVVIAWCFYAVGVNLETYANSGWRFGIGSSVSAFDWFKIGGSDYGRNPYGGWFNVAIDPTATEDGVIGGGNGGSYRYFGSIPYTLAEISKGTPSAVDAIRKGRGIISITGTGGSFLELSSYNDYNAGGTPPGTSSTSVDTGRHRLGLFQNAGGTYLWKGLLSLGTSGTSVTFSDSNETIIIDDTPSTYLTFNKVEVNNASSSVTLNNITFISLGSVSPGTWENVANATLNKTGCSFNDMGAFTYGSNTTISNCVYNSCGLITTSNALISDTSFNSLTGTVGVLTASTTEAARITDSAFVSDGTGHGLQINGTAANVTLTGLIFTGYASSNGSTGNEAIYVNIASGSMTITIDGGSIPSIRTAGASVTVVSGARTVTVSVVDTDGQPVTGSNVFLAAASGGPFPYNDTVTITRSGTTATVAHTAHGLATNDYVIFRGITDKIEDNVVKQITVTSVDAYTFTTSDSGSTSYTGTILSTFVFLKGNATSGTGSNEISMSRQIPSNQPVVGWARKSTSAPFYKTGSIAGIVLSSGDSSFSAVMISDD